MWNDTDSDKESVLVTGAAGFIGYFLSKRLLREGFRVVGIDNLNDYYDVQLKLDRLYDLGIPPHVFDDNVYMKGTLPEAEPSGRYESFRFYQVDLSDRPAMEELFEREPFDYVVNLAAQAGVRYSLENPHAYLDSNVIGFLNILEGCRHNPVRHLVYASSSSVYGANKEMPFRTSDNVDRPVSLYAATKKSNELMAHTYSHLFDIPATGLRFFTVYGPWGRPDMAYFKFADLMRAGKAIDVYNFGKMSRDFTYIDDIVESMVRLLPKPPAEEEGVEPPHLLFNIGHNSPVDLMAFIEQVEKHLGMTAEKNLMEMQPGDVPSTWADVSDLFTRIGYKPQVGLEVGIGKFATWYRDYYGV